MKSLTRLVFLTLGLGLLSAVPVAAQAHPCDASPGTTATVVAGSLTVGWCHDGRDTNGNPTVTASWALYANTVRTPLTGVVSNGVANAGGLVYYSTSVVFAVGNYDVTVAGVNGIGEGPASTPFALSVSVPSARPSAPSRTRIAVS